METVGPYVKLAAAIAVVLGAACSRQQAQSDEQRGFESPEAAVTALVGTIEDNDLRELGRILGPGTDTLVNSGDDAADRLARGRFVTAYNRQHRLVAGSHDDLVLQVGADNWPLPIPLVREDGRWRFDGAAGADEIVTRRIGANELRTIDVMRSFVVAQREYADIGHDGVSAGAYARRLRSEPGKQNGLYWQAAAGDAPSPAGPLLAQAAAEGYDKERVPYHGYLYRMLLSQGPAANGGALEYLVGDELRNGFALLAHPAQYGASGIMTFQIDQDGVVWQKDLGADTERLAAQIQQFNPDAGWTPLAEESLQAQRPMNRQHVAMVEETMVEQNVVEQGRARQIWGECMRRAGVPRIERAPSGDERAVCERGRTPL